MQHYLYRAIAGGAEPYKAQIGTMLTALPSNMMDRLSDALAFPQRAITKLFTGKYQTPSEAMNIQNPLGAVATDILLDPLTLVGAGASKAAKTAKLANAAKPELSNLRYVVKRKPYEFDASKIKGTSPEQQKKISEAVNKAVNTFGDYVEKETYKRHGSYKKDPLTGKPTRVVKQDMYLDMMANLPDVNLVRRNKNGGWLDKYDAPQAQNGIEGTMGGLTDIGFNYNGAWNGPSMQMGGSLPGATGMMYARTQSPAPSNGPYAKKTKASAQNGQEMKYYQEGLDFKPKTISQNGSRTPIVVSDPNDPRLRAYQDSLRTYNNYYNKYLPGGIKAVNESRSMEEADKKFKEIEKLYINAKLATRFYPNDASTLLARKTFPGGRQSFYRDAEFKKPVQPVILEEEPKFEKPIPIPRDTRDLGYTLPTPGQFTAPKLFEYNPDTPTKFSFTYPTGGYNEQKTIYFPTRSAWKSYVEGIKGTEKFKGSQEGVDYAQATGYLQDGGDIPVDPMGYWNPENVGNPVTIPSNVITMEGVDQPLLGISDTGDVQYMEPGEDYEFDGEYVTEYPMAKGGVSVNNADAQPLKKLDQLLNFTNYNKPTKGGWLDKYN